MQARPARLGMATTLSGAAVTTDGLEWVSVGDSAIYVLRPGEACRQANERHNPRWSARKLTAVLDGQPPRLVSRSMRPWRLGPADTVVIATDGLNCVRRTEMTRIAANTRWLAAGLVRHALSAGRKQQGNVTVATLRMDDARKLEQDDETEDGRR